MELTDIMQSLVPEMLLVLVVSVQMIVMIGQFYAQRQQTRLAVLDKRVQLFEAMIDCTRTSVSLREDCETYELDRVVSNYIRKCNNLLNLFKSYQYLFDCPTRKLMNDMINDCHILYLHIDDGGLELEGQFNPLSDNDRSKLEQQLAGPKLDRLTKLAGRHFRVSRFLR
jgi:hypothetical protein